MAKVVTHLSKMVQRRDYHLTGTLCNRMSNAGDDLNVADTDDQVTCKLCIKQMKYRKNRS